MVVEVVARQVREGRGGEADAIEAALLDAVEAAVAAAAVRPLWA